MEVRSYRPGDADALGRVFHQAVRNGASARYDAAQLAAWSPQAPGGARWAERLAYGETVVAEDTDRVLGFMTLNPDGYLDLAFVLPEVMGQGVSDRLYAVLETRARARGVERMTTQASLLAEGFFARHGWVVTRRQEVEINGAVLRNAWMEKDLARLAA